MTGRDSSCISMQGGRSLALPAGLPKARTTPPARLAPAKAAACRARPPRVRHEAEGVTRSPQSVTASRLCGTTYGCSVTGDPSEGPTSVQHLPEVLKILDSALRHDPGRAKEYALLLAEKLEREALGRQAQALRRTLSRAPAVGVVPAWSEGALPRDSESQLSMVDVVQTDGPGPQLVLHPFVSQQVEEFIQAIESRSLLLENGIELASRLLLCGAPGTGKTQLAHSIAHRLGLPLVVVRSDALVSSLLGQTSRNLRQVFEFADRRPCVVLLDEFDAFAKRRDDTQEVGELQRVVVALLQNLDAFDSSNVLIAATNHPELMDRAIGRRFTTRIDIPLPTELQRREIWRLRLGRQAPSEVELGILAGATAGLTGATIELAATDARRFTVTAGREIATAPLVLRRVARLLWYDKPWVFESTESEIRELRSWMPSVFTYRALAEAFETTTRQVGNVLRRGNAAGGRSGADLAGQDPPG